MRFVQKHLIKLCTKYLNKHKAIYCDMDTKLLFQGSIYYIVSYQARSAIDEVDSLQIEAHSPGFYLKKG